MKASILSLLLLLFYIDAFSQAKFDQGIEHKVKFSKSKKKKRTRRVKENLGSGNKRKMKIAYGIGLYKLKMNEKTNLMINDKSLYLEGRKVGSYSYIHNGSNYQNTAIYADRTTSWVTYEIPETYEYTNSTNGNRQAFGFNFEARMVKDDGLGSPTGFLFQSGAYFFNKTLTGLDHNVLELIFPLGLGVIIPGNQDFWIEIGASSILGSRNTLGGKFDFSLVWRKIKFTPSFMYLENKQDITFKSGGIGLGLTYIPKKINKYRKRR